MIRVKNIKINRDMAIEDIINIAYNNARIRKNDIDSWHIYKKSIDARHKNNINIIYTIDFILKDEVNYLKHTNFKRLKDVELINNHDIYLDNLKIDVNRKSTLKPVIIGAGPAGLFAALTLAQNGIPPILIEQGKPANERKKDVDNFLNSSNLNIYSNVQFGEGGAGTFSDGKLTTGINNPLCKKVLKEFYNFGAPEQILYLNKPHIGTDNLINIVQNIRNEIIRLGGTVLFNTKAIDFKIQNNKIEEVIVQDVTNSKLNSANIYSIKTDSVVLAIGHSARDTFEVLYNKGINMQKKNFSVGLRIEHKQDLINKSQYGDKPNLTLPPADYKLAYHNTNTLRSCYTFCMCPGGTVIASSSEKNTIVTNGMSTFARDGENSNSAILVNITPEDFKDSSPLAGVYFQKQLEENAFKLGGSNYFAPIQRVEDFIKNRPSTFIGNVKPTYKPGTTLSNLNDILPDFVSSTLKEGILYFDTKLHGFADNDAILTGVETRSSSPVQITRNKDSLVSNIIGIYPCGEGAGYAGGIVSAAVDGIKCAIAILENNKI